MQGSTLRSVDDLSVQLYFRRNIIALANIYVF